MYRVMDTLEDERWTGMKIRYEKPHVDRVWLQLANRCRLCLHKIYPLEDGRAFYHPHPWEFETFLAKGSYFSDIGYNTNHESQHGIKPPPVAVRILLSEGSWYSMADSKTWHTVEPIDEPVYSIIITKKRWDVKALESCQDNKTMNSEEIAGLLQDFSNILNEKCPSLICSPTKSPAFFEASTSHHSELSQAT